jgi:hypothetical protein
MSMRPRIPPLVSEVYYRQKLRMAFVLFGLREILIAVQRLEIC